MQSSAATQSSAAPAPSGSNEMLLVSPDELVAAHVYVTGDLISPQRLARGEC
jgi:hypothetical protein